MASRVNSSVTMFLLSSEERAAPLRAENLEAALDLCWARVFIDAARRGVVVEAVVGVDAEHCAGRAGGVRLLISNLCALRARRASRCACCRTAVRGLLAPRKVAATRLLQYMSTTVNW